MPTVENPTRVVDASQSETLQYMRLAYQLAEKFSDDPRTQTAAVLLGREGTPIGSGVNAFPVGVQVTPERLERPKKYAFMEHAERNAIFAAVRAGHHPGGSTLICPWFACADCARALINVGVRHIIGHKQIFDHAGEGSWSESIAVGNEMFLEAGVTFEYLDADIDDVSILFNGELWTPVSKLEGAAV